MSQDISKALETALSRIAALEAERTRKPEAPTFDPREFARAITADPVGAMTKLGIPVDHVNRVLVAHTLGDAAPPELKMLASMGPQHNATQALQTQLETLSRQFSDFQGAQSKNGKRESFKALTADKAKYPNLAKAREKDAAFFDEDVAAFGGSAEDFAAREEARLSKLGYFTPQPASDEDADTTGTNVPTDQSMQVKPAVAASLNGEMPLITKPKVGVFTAEDHSKLRDEIVRKISQTA